jgi:hypothetical protein
MAIKLFESAVKEAIEQKERKEAFRQKHEKAQTLREDVMKRFYNILNNGNKPVLLEKVTFNRIINKHGNKGLIGISANRSDMPQERNDEKTKELISDLQKSGYSYLPTYGGYRGKNGVEDDYEPSFIVFNYTTDGKECNFEELRQFGVYLCGKYEQDSVLIKAPDAPAIYVDSTGEKTNSKESNTVWKNDPKQEYFTSLKSKDDVDSEIMVKMKAKYKSYCRKNNIPQTSEGFKKFYEEHLNDIKKIGRRYTYDIQFTECYVNPMPCQLNERMRRVGEVMIWE